MSNNPKYQDGEWLHQQYIGLERSTVEIAEECDCTTTTVSDWLSRHDIEARDSSQQLPDERLNDAEWLRDKYVGELLTSGEIAAECGCCETTVQNYLKEHGIDTDTQERRELRVADKRLLDAEWLKEQHINKGQSAQDIGSVCACHPDTVRRWLRSHGIELQDESRHLADERLTDPEWLREKYTEEGWALYDIAEECGCNDSTVSRWFDNHDISTDRCPGWGEDNPNWKGGPPSYGAGWNEKKRKEVRDRDGHTCQDPRCSTTQAEHLENHGLKLHVHHLRRARDVDDAGRLNAKENLITLCCVCHRQWEQIADTGLVPEVISDGDA